MGRMKESAGDLFDYSSRINYRETSRLAWEQMIPLTAELDRLILTEIQRYGTHGIICQQIEENICRSHQAVSGNLRHLVERGLVEPSGQHGKTTSGRKAMCWRIKAQ